MFKKLVLLLVLVSSLVLFAACGEAAPAAEAEEAPAAAAEEAEEAAEEPAMEEDEWGYITIPAGEKVKIGLSSALSGAYAVYGNDMLYGVEVAIQDTGDLMGWEVEVEGQDDLCDGAPGVTVAEYFSAEPYLLGVVGPMCSGSVVPASAIYGANNVLMISPSSTAVKVTAQGFENIFRTVANDALQAEVTADYLINELGVSSVSVAHDQSIYGEGVAAAVKLQVELLDGTVPAYEGLTRGESDFSAVIAKLLEGEPEAVYWGGMDAEGALLVNQLRAAGFEGTFFGPDGIKSKPSFVDASGGSAEGAFMTFGAVGGATGYDEFEATFTEQFGEPVAYGPGSYDSAMIMLNAAAEVAFVDADGNLNIPRKALADAVRAAPHSGITGFLEFDDAGDLKVVSITVFKVIDSEIVEQKTYDFGE